VDYENIIDPNLLFCPALITKSESSMKETILRQIRYIPFVILVLSVFTACERPEVVSFEEKEEVKVETTTSDKETIKIVIGAMITPRTGFAYYRQLLDYIGNKLGKPVELVTRESYKEANDLLKNNKVHAAFVCGKPYVDGNKEFGLELLVAPQMNGKTVYHSYIVVHKESSINNIEDLRGKTFAFVDPGSNTGTLVPTFIVAQMGETPDSFFDDYIYTYGHDKSIKAVSQRIVDGAAVDSLIYDYSKHFDTHYADKTKIIFQSPPYGIPPVVVPREIDPGLRNSLKTIFLNIHNAPAGHEILKGMAIDRFVEVDDSAYDGIREMKDYLSRKDLM
jgi:phosphonate transport system substrate-binding protein